MKPLLLATVLLAGLLACHPVEQFAGAVQLRRELGCVVVRLSRPQIVMAGDAEAAEPGPRLAHLEDRDMMGA